MPFRSILFPGAGAVTEPREDPPFFADLNLDQVFAAVVAGREEYDLDPFFRAPLRNAAAVAERQVALRDLEGKPLRAAVDAFARALHTMRAHLAQVDKLHYDYQKASWFLDAVAIYCRAVRGLGEDLGPLRLTSAGFQELRAYVAAYAASERFQTLAAETQRLKDALAGVAYTVHVRGKRITVRRFGDEPDYSADVEETFRKFRQGEAKDYRVSFYEPAEMNHVEANVLDLVARLYPDIFAELREFGDRHAGYLDPTLRRFDREVQFYLAYLDYIARFEAAGLAFCYPRVSDRSKEVGARGTFDLALAGRLLPERSPVVCNDFHLEGPECVIVVSGPNQGGKTTFARTFGQLHHLGALGLPVPGREAHLFLSDGIFTHFEREEQIENLRGKLQDELVRIRDILERSSGDSILIMNESFASTTLTDALFLGRVIMREIIRRDTLCVYVTFIEELSRLGESVVSMVSTVVPDNPAERTFRIVRRPAEGLAYAAAIAEKYGLTYSSVKGHLAR